MSHLENEKKNIIMDNIQRHLLEYPPQPFTPFVITIKINGNVGEEQSINVIKTIFEDYQGDKSTIVKCRKLWLAGLIPIEIIRKGHKNVFYAMPREEMYGRKITVPMKLAEETIPTVDSFYD